MAAGVVYALRNSSLPGLLKIGGSGDSAGSRAKKLSGTGIPDDYSVVWEQPVSDWKAAEALAHQKLGSWRDRDRREFFRVTERQAIDALKTVALAFPAGGRSLGAGVEVITVGATEPSRIVECNAPGLEVHWNAPWWIAPLDGHDYSQIPDVDFHFAGDARAARFIPQVSSVILDGQRWALRTGRHLVPALSDARNASIKVSLYRKEDRLRARLVQLVTRFRDGERVLRVRQEASLGAMNHFLGTWSRGYKEASVSHRQAIEALYEVGEAIEQLVDDPTRWASEERQGFWLYKEKVYEVLRSDLGDDEAAIVVRHHAEHERARLRRLKEEAARLAGEEE